MMLILVVVILFIVINYKDDFIKGAQKKPSSRELLDEKYVNNEISEEEYLRMKKILKE